MLGSRAVDLFTAPPRDRHGAAMHPEFLAISNQKSSTLTSTGTIVGVGRLTDRLGFFGSVNAFGTNIGCRPHCRLVGRRLVIRLLRDFGIHFCPQGVRSIVFLQPCGVFLLDGCDFFDRTLPSCHDVFAGSLCSCSGCLERSFGLTNRGRLCPSGCGLKVHPG